MSLAACQCHQVHPSAWKTDTDSVHKASACLISRTTTMTGRVPVPAAGSAHGEPSNKTPGPLAPARTTPQNETNQQDQTRTCQPQPRRVNFSGASTNGYQNNDRLSTSTLRSSIRRGCTGDSPFHDCLGRCAPTSIRARAVTDKRTFVRWPLCASRCV